MEDGGNPSLYNLGVEAEFRFVAVTDVTLELLSGYAEILGAEVTRNKVYTFPSSSSVSLYTWKGCTLKLNGNVESTEISQDSLIMIHVAIHACLEEMRIQAEIDKTKGPVSMVVGPTDVGKSAFCRMLLNYAARLGRRPVLVDLDVGQNSLSMPGTICILPVESQADVVEGFNQQTLSVYPFGYKSPGHNIALYFLLIKKLGQLIKTRMKNANPNTQCSGIVIDTCGWVRSYGYSAITLAACSFEIDILFVIEEERLYLELKKDMPSSVKVVYVPKQCGVRERSRADRAKARDTRIWEYFYGAKGNLNPFEIQVKFSDVKIYTVKATSCSSSTDPQNVTTDDLNIVSVTFGSQLENSILGLSVADSIHENFMYANVIGFVCVINVDINEEVMTVLSPQPGPLPSKILIMGDMRLKNPDTSHY